MVLTLRCCNWTLLTLLKASRQDCEWNTQHSVWGHKSQVIFVRNAEPQVIPSTAPILELLSQVVFDGNVLAPHFSGAEVNSSTSEPRNLRPASLQKLWLYHTVWAEDSDGREWNNKG